VGPSLGCLLAWALTAHGVVRCSQGDAPTLPATAHGALAYQTFFLGR
jgi:hypothetical protein